MKKKEVHPQDYSFIQNLVGKIYSPAYVINSEGVIIGCNLIFCSTLGFNSPKEVINQPLSNFLVHEQNEMIIHSNQHALETQEIILNQEIYLNKLNHQCIFHSFKLPLRSSQGSIYLLNILFDLKQSSKETTGNKEILQTEVYLDNIVAHMPGSIYWKDKEGIFLGCNQFVVEMAGVNSTRDIIGKSDYELVWRDIADQIRKNDLEIMYSKHEKVFEELVTLADGSRITMLTNKAPMFDQHGDVIGILGVSVDISNHKQLENELKKAKEKAEAASHAKSNFIANMSHDIRTPITGVLGLAQSLKDHSESETNRKEAQLLIGATEQLLSLLNEIIEVVRIEEGKLTNDRRDFDLIAIVENTIELLQPALRDKELNLNYQIDPQMPRYLFGHRLYLDRILLNLLSNAIKFTEEGQVSLVISAKEIKEAQKNVVIQIVVEDTGIGIPTDKKEAIFEHFSRLSPSYEGRYKGYGLGLYTVKRYLEAMKGHIEVESELGKGSYFTLTIPFKLGKKVDSKIVRVFEQESVANRFSPELIKEISQEKVPLRKKIGPTTRILLVEDNELAALMATRLLAERNCEIVHVKTGTDALEQIAREHFNLILMDLGLPDQSGFEVARQIRARAGYLNAETPIVALTGHMSSDKRKECLAAGMQDMLTKPLTAPAGQQLLIKYASSSLETSKPQKPEVATELLAIDLEDGMNILGGDLASAKEALDMLAQSLPVDYQQIQTHYKAKNYEALYQTIHRLYGGLCYCGTPRLREVTRLLKQDLRDKKTQELPLLMERLADEVERFQQAYQHLKLQDEF